ncbi:MAG: hypothetical protein IT236_09350 [Bacteroidia bacterium]|nr:hypothetical protein [Bacteroidia bacterium]
MSLQKIKAILRHKKYRIYSRPYELNIVGLRSKSTEPNRFDDEIHVFYKVSALNWHYHVFSATTDPGTYWLRQPMQPQGTAILSQGQYVDAYELGLHRGQYTALVQRKPLSIVRDYNRDAVLDFNNGHTINGQFGINIHRANRTGSTLHVDKNSAGCQVFKNASDFEFFMGLCHHHKQLYGNHFTYSLIDFRALRRQNLRYVLSGVGLAGLIGLAYATVVHGDKIKSIAGEISDFFSDLLQTKKQTTTTPTHENQF